MATTGEPGVATEIDGNKPSRDEVHEVLSNHRRRYALHYLKQNGRDVELGDLSERIAAWENEIGIEDVSSDQRKRVYTSLRQYHLPKLDEKGLVEFDQRSGTVELTDRGRGLDVYVEVIDRYDVPWSLYYVGLSAIGGILLGATSLGIPPFASIPVGAWSVFLVTALFVSAVAHTVITRRNRIGTQEEPPELEDG